jgi:predicted transcriptional regulator
MNNGKVKRRRKRTYFKSIDISENTNTILYGLMMVHNIPAKELAKKINCNVRTIQGIVQGRNTSDENMKKIADIFNVPKKVLFWKKF